MKNTNYEISERAWAKQSRYARVIADLVAVHQTQPDEKILANYKLAKKIWERACYGIK